MTAPPRRSLNFRWPVDDLAAVRTTYLAARRTYRESDPATLSLTLSAFTETAYRVARLRLSMWRPAVLEASAAAAACEEGRQALALTWHPAVASLLDDDWDLLAAEVEIAHWEATARGTRPRVLKSDVARIGVLAGLADWRTWVRNCPNDSRRLQR